MPRTTVRHPWAVALVFAAGCASSAGPEGAGPSSGPPEARSADPVVVQPGAPGQATRTVDNAALDLDRLPAVSEADVRFMQGMIPHHAQALVMTDLVRRNSRSDAIRQMALRMEISQRDEIAVMTTWLETRGHGPAASAAHEHGGAPGMDRMPGMLSPQQIEQLTQARGPEFDRLFLEFMIQHHEGAIVMVEQLFGTPGGGQASEVFQLASHIDADQRMEIDRMRSMLDPAR